MGSDTFDVGRPVMCGCGDRLVAIFPHMALVVTDAIVLHVFNYLESSRIVRLATRALGVQSVVARGARRPASRFGASLDVFATGVAQLHVRPGRELHNLGGFDVTRSRFALAADLDRFAASSALVELAARFGHSDADGEAFDVLDSALDALAESAHDAATEIGLSSAWRFAAAQGFAPSIDRCSVCHQAIAPDESASFSHAGGGVVCANCRATASVSRHLPATARASLRAWLQNEPSPPLSEPDRRAHLRLLREFLHHHLSDGRELRAMAAWEAGRRTGP